MYCEEHQDPSVVAATTFMPTTRNLLVAIGTSVTAIVLAIFFNCCSDVNNANAGRASTFHLSNSSHRKHSYKYSRLKTEQLFIYLSLTLEQLFRYNPCQT